MESDEDDEETQASFCRFLDDNFKLPISAYAPGCVPKVKIKERLNNGAMREEKAKEYYKLLYDSTKALFGLSDNLCCCFNWYYQELYYIKLASFFDDTLDYVKRRPKVIENSIFFDAWIARLLKGREQLYEALSPDELLYVHYRRVRAAHMFQDAYEYDDEEKKNLGKPVHIIQRNGEKRDYSRQEAEEIISKIHSTYGFHYSNELDLYFDRKLEPILTKMRLDLNEILHE